MALDTQDQATDRKIDMASKPERSLQRVANGESALLSERKA
jgi:hypothetical protein